MFMIIRMIWMIMFMVDIIANLVRENQENFQKFREKKNK